MFAKKYIERALQLTVEDQHCIIDEVRKENISIQIGIVSLKFVSNTRTRIRSYIRYRLS